jgi:glutamate-1-semialdehyde 2,1-aminomutase
LPIIRAIQSTAERGTSFGIPHAQEVTMAQRVKSLVPSVEKVFGSRSTRGVPLGPL